MKSEFPVFERFLDFAYADLSQMSELEKNRLATRLFLDIEGLSLLLRDRPGKTETGINNLLDEYFETEKEYIQSMLDGLPSTQEHTQNLILLLFQKLKIQLLEAKHKNQTAYNTLDLWKLEANFQITAATVCPDQPHDQETALCKLAGMIPLEGGVINISSRIKAPFWKRFEYCLFMSLQGMPVSALMQCPDCKKVFVHTSKKQRTYCSNKCAARSNVRVKRTQKD